MEIVDASNDILFLLSIIDEKELNAPGRLMIQKILYLSNALQPLLKGKVSDYSFYRYKYGPYSKAIQNGLNSLIVSKMIDLESYSGYPSTDENQRSEYNITEGGKELTKRLVLLREYKDRADRIELTIKMLDGSYYKHVKNLVYQEPYFKEMQTLGKWGPIDLKKSRAIREQVNYLLDLVRQKWGFSIQNKENIIKFYFDYLNFLHINGG